VTLRWIATPALVRLKPYQGRCGAFAVLLLSDRLIADR